MADIILIVLTFIDCNWMSLLVPSLLCSSTNFWSFSAAHVNVSDRKYIAA
jgi:hypothetical protein